MLNDSMIYADSNYEDSYSSYDNSFFTVNGWIPAAWIGWFQN